MINVISSQSDTPMARRVSSNTLAMGPTPIKIIGHAANLHSELVLWEEQEEEEEAQDEGGHAISSQPPREQITVYSYAHSSTLWLVFSWGLSVIKDILNFYDIIPLKHDEK